MSNYWFMKLKQLLQVLALVSLPMPAIAQAYSSEWQAAMDSASPRLRLFALSRAQPDGGQSTAQELQRHLGFAHLRGPQSISHSWAISPLASYDANINGGTPGETIKIGPYIFTLDPASQAKSGMVFGVSPSAKLRFSLEKGTVVDLSASADLSRSFQHNLNRQSFGSSACLGQYLGSADWLDLCAGQRASIRALGNSRENYASIGVARQFATGLGLHEITVRLQNTQFKDFSQPALDFGITTANQSLGVLNLRLDGGKYTAGEHTRLFGANLSLTRPIFGKRTTVFAGYAREGGALFFGTPRGDEIYSVGANFSVSKQIGISLSLRKRTSTLENYNGTSAGFDVSFTGSLF